MIQSELLRGTGEEICRYAGEHLQEHFVLLKIEEPAKRTPFDEAKFEQTLKRIHALKGTLPSIPDEVLTTDSLYD